MEEEKEKHINEINNLKKNIEEIKNKNEEKIKTIEDEKKK
jgi:hypothetical protein